MCIEAPYPRWKFPCTFVLVGFIIRWSVNNSVGVDLASYVACKQHSSRERVKTSPVFFDWSTVWIGRLSRQWENIDSQIDSHARWFNFLDQKELASLIRIGARFNDRDIWAIGQG